MNPLRELVASGQAVWFDYIRRSLVTSGQLQRMIDEDDLRGVTANPSIFEKAIAGSTDYTAALADLARHPALDAKAIYERLAIDDVQRAADVLAPVYERTGGLDGYVSLEVSPALAHDTDGTCAEARRLWQRLARPNVMIKVPATPAGIPAIATLIAEGININVTLIFSRAVYAEVAEAHLAGLERRLAAGQHVAGIASVASFFVSRVDSAIEARVEERRHAGLSVAAQAKLARLLGTVAIANSKLAYQDYLALTRTPRFQVLAGRGARPQRLLWASTGTKNPRYSDVYYVEELIGRETVNTVPPATYDAFRDHGRVRPTLDQDLDEAREVLQTLAEVGIALDEVTAQLLEDGVTLFSHAFDKLLSAVAAPGQKPCRPVVARQRSVLPAPIEADLHAATGDWQTGGKVARLWARDATLWTGADEARWMGWLGVTEDRLAHLDRLDAIAEAARTDGFDHALLLGMGGSSLCPDVLKTTFGRVPGAPELLVLDSTDPAQVQRVAAMIDPARTLFIVSSKSGTTLEPNILTTYFYDCVCQALGAEEAGRRFVAITDPGSSLQEMAERDGFRCTFEGVPSIGGRYSALSNFGLVPAAIMGLDIERLLDRADEMVQSCAPCVPVADNPGVVLGLALGVAARTGRDKVTFITSPSLRGMGAWLEQLLAESTGKLGKGLIPVDREQIGPCRVYGDDRLFVYLRLDSAFHAAQDAAVARLEQAGHPLVRLDLRDPYDLGGEFFRWEIATAVAGSVLGINPFDQPDVEASKIATRRLTDEYEAAAELPPEVALVGNGRLAVYADVSTARQLGVGSGESVVELLRTHLARLSAGDYFAVLAYVDMNERYDAELQTLRHVVRDAKRVATCLGYGPRFLHSTGQAYKGGPASGVFLQITGDDAVDLPVPGRRYTFGVVKAAQARGDFHVLAERGRRALRVHLRHDVHAGLRRLAALVAEAVA